jgi:muconolactone delta-isomerase
MKRVLVITYPRQDDRIAAVMDDEWAMTNAWRDQGIIEHLFAKEDGGGVVIFTGHDVENVRALVAQLPLYPFFEKVDYLPLDQVY